MIYFTKDTALPPFVPLPRFIIQGKYTVNAKLLYGLLLNRTLLSRKSGWYAENGAVYVIYTIKQMADDLNRNEHTVKTALAELENAGLIQLVRQRWNRANHIFLKLPDEVQFSSSPEGNACPLSEQDSSHCIGQTLPTSNNNQKNNRISKNDCSEESHRFGEFQNVFLTNSQFADLQALYPRMGLVYIERLSQYMASTEKNYRNHYATIKSWIAQDSKKSPASKFDYNYTYEEGECL